MNRKELFIIIQEYKGINNGQNPTNLTMSYISFNELEKSFVNSTPFYFREEPLLFISIFGVDRLRVVRSEDMTEREFFII